MIVHSVTLVMINGDEYTRHNLDDVALDNFRTRLRDPEARIYQIEEHLQSGVQTRLVFVDKIVSIEIVSYEVDPDPVPAGGE
jgi:hypothetical protein